MLLDLPALAYATCVLLVLLRWARAHLLIHGSRRAFRRLRGVFVIINGSIVVGYLAAVIVAGVVGRGERGRTISVMEEVRRLLGSCVR